VSTADDLRSRFDHEFALPIAAKATDELDLLAIRIDGDPHAIRLAEITGVFTDQPIAPAPSTAPSFIGLTGVRTSIVPVFDLAVLLGYPRATRPRWLVVAEQLGFAFDTFEGHVRVPATAFARHTDVKPHTIEVVRIGEQTRSVVQLATVVEVVAKKEK
jgi:chemotaxis signal transduction protein